MTDYAKSDYYYRHHVERYTRAAEARRPRLGCQFCGGHGGWTEVIDRELGGPWITCGMCCGCGAVLPHDRGLYLRMMKEAKR
jgi:hypothetical protein